MGTRNLTMLVSNNQTKISQYGQWDGYPSGQGVTILSYMRTVDIDDLKKTLESENLRFFTDDDEKEYEKYSKSIGIADGWMNMDQKAKMDVKYPFLSRDIGGEIIEQIYTELKKENPSLVLLGDSTEFAISSQGFGCEWAYVVDLDKEVLEVYDGYSNKDVEEHERFYRENACPVKYICSFDLRNLPTDTEFVDMINQMTGDEETEKEE